MNSRPAGAEKKILLDARHISVSFSRYAGLWSRRRLEVIRDLSVALREGEMVAVAGASGSGKSLLAHAILDILPRNASLGGELFYRGERLTRERARALRGREIVLVPQSVSCLDPLMKVGPQLRRGRDDGANRARSRDALGRYGLGAETEGLYPFELSGGMARRVLIASAVMESPRLVIADEPTPGLHAGAARRVMGHFREIAGSGAGVLVITHDLELAAETADRVVVFHAGVTIEEAAASDFADERRLRHPYTRALWRARPAGGFFNTPVPPGAADGPGPGCPFSHVCEMADEACAGERGGPDTPKKLEKIPYRAAGGGYVRCVKGGYREAGG